MALCLSYRAVSEEVSVYSLLPQNARRGLGFSSFWTFNPQFYYQSFAFQDLRKHFCASSGWSHIGYKTPQQNKIKAHCSYKLHDQAVHPWNCVNWIGREAILREASKAKPSGINTLFTSSLSVMKMSIIISSLSPVPSSSACCLLFCTLSVKSWRRSCALWYICHCSAFQARS